MVMVELPVTVYEQNNQKGIAVVFYHNSIGNSVFD